MIIYYDGYCKMCTRTSTIWEKLDWNNRLEFQSFRSLNEYSDEMEESLHISHKGKWQKGYTAIVEISKRLPLMWAFVPFLYIFKWLGLGDFIYRKIAKNRKLVPVNQCQDGSCQIDS
ncbi:thiol-disulfide oxidoreductase DCC family protein [Virgibacillus kekensis]|uniref:Thiol-disulfide oxidoreductase DCC family protein n=1 Tax=Virgibacillus kekensis TaxID=202261 RepID=A0ABV9DFR8_9BACI